MHQLSPVVLSSGCVVVSRKVVQGYYHSSVFVGAGVEDGSPQRVHSTGDVQGQGSAPQCAVQGFVLLFNQIISHRGLYII